MKDHLEDDIRKELIRQDGIRTETVQQDNNTFEDLLREIPEIVAMDDDRYELVTESCISLKHLFSRQEMDRHHVDCLVLYQIALRVLHIMEELKARKIYPGLYALEDFYTDLGKGCLVYLTHPERFQREGVSQDYEWYPEDEAIFEGVETFDEPNQELADSRLIYKILVASVKGNVQVPPRETRADYSFLFYKTLPPDLAQVYINHTRPGHDRLKILLLDAIRLEKESARMVMEKQREASAEVVSEPASQVLEQEAYVPALDHGTTISESYTMFVLLRTEVSHSGKTGKLLYQEQDRLELDCRLSRRKSYQAFVYGDDYIKVRAYRSYPEGFRVQLPQQIRDYSSAEALNIACELVKKEMEVQGRAGMGPDHEDQLDKEGQREETIKEYGITMITDGRLKNDKVFQYALIKLKDLKKQGCQLKFLCDTDCRCEACDRLQELCE